MSDCRSGPVAGALANPLPGLFINVIGIIRYLKDMPALRAGQQNTRSADNQTQHSLAIPADHARALPEQ
ncbi:MAG TPA: hypothetical protein VK445_04115 [Dissulfurispiraceae bacterium]|nr:hypothetical protein [Dissulfurispiraceae bacterium]